MFLINNPDWKSVVRLKGPSNKEGSDLTFVDSNNNVITVEAKSKMMDFHGAGSVRVKRLKNGKLEIIQGQNPMSNFMFNKVKNYLTKTKFVNQLDAYLKFTKAKISEKGAISVTKKAHEAARDNSKVGLPNSNIKI